eukprot:TRINITY_DN37674_c0_g1_i1.p1 TRINITY_DN37674_c0_g1~~TRINITY_DN37674_c0_g1_i1.p1  ORF type:complete len:402 (+),score=89.18 TRINITY_DN37674_c0_g1_i1:92-1297(+)
MVSFSSHAVRPLAFLGAFVTTADAGALIRRFDPDSAPQASAGSLLEVNVDSAERQDAHGFTFQCTPPLPVMNSDAWPGTPIEPKEDNHIKIAYYNASLAALGDRLVKAADASEAARACGSFFNFGDYTWCNRAMPQNTDYARKNVYGGNTCKVTTPPAGMSLLDVDTDGDHRVANNGQYLGLSYGIEETDPWSELMSSMYFVPTRLFDCYIQSTKGPMFNDMTGDHSKENQCTTRNCYSIPYEKNRVCLEDMKSERDGRKYDTLKAALHGRAPLSTFVKMDVEGSEWRVLDQLLKSPEDIDRIRTLDMETHMRFNVNDGIPLERRVEILEEMAKKFAVTGSNIEPMHIERIRDQKRELEKDPNLMKDFGIYTSRGLPLDQYTISFVNRRILKGEDTHGVKQ